MGGPPTPHIWNLIGRRVIFHLSSTVGRPRLFARPALYSPELSHCVVLLAPSHTGKAHEAFRDRLCQRRRHSHRLGRRRPARRRSVRARTLPAANGTDPARHAPPRRSTHPRGAAHPLRLRRLTLPPPSLSPRTR